ncbi:MAG: cytochrome c family protein [Roseibium sp.]|uniref:multiheme c-type cytochrome n=1 Tax=Roseibium sp. TaxID=1936156 RepID=UPI00261B40C6|nr:multiheme c-type cytochrome [Roseibium sp.]MCV0429191.1 cytochrome c family protein [Roseibium sp.]
MNTLLRIGLFVLLIGSGGTTANSQSDKQPGYVGSMACSSCHERETSAWKKPHHANAWKLPSEDTVDRDFDNAEFAHKGKTSRFYSNEDDFFIETSDFIDAPMTFKVAGVAGFSPLQQYLIETEQGRLQSFDVVWDQEKKTWYHPYPAQKLKPEDGCHWSSPYKNWNARCAECHSAGIKENYSLSDRRYNSTQAEINVGCEACHGPGENHLSWTRKPGQKMKSTFSGHYDKGFTIGISGSDPQIAIEQCAARHSRRESFQDFSPVTGTPFHDSYRLALLRDGLYHPDGQILEEVYVYGSFLLSKMHDIGVRCSNCQDPHGSRLQAKENSVCTQCHSQIGNSGFPTLIAKLYDDRSHHFHEPGTEGAQCVSCHMIERDDMGIDGKRDHSFRVPRPDLSKKI